MKREKKSNLIKCPAGDCTCQRVAHGESKNTPTAIYAHENILQKWKSKARHNKGATTFVPVALLVYLDLLLCAYGV